MVKSNLGHELTINNTSLGTTSRALYESIAERWGMPADALTVIHYGRELPNNNSELGMTTLGGSHTGKLDELHLTVVVRKRPGRLSTPPDATVPAAAERATVTTRQ